MAERLRAAAEVVECAFGGFSFGGDDIGLSVDSQGGKGCGFREARVCSHGQNEAELSVVGEQSGRLL